MFDLYRQYNAAGDLLYIGQSLNAFKRHSSHKNASAWFDEIATMTIQKYETRADVEWAEKRAIHRENPRHNKQRPDYTPEWQGPTQPGVVSVIPVCVGTPWQFIGEANKAGVPLRHMIPLDDDLEVSRLMAAMRKGQSIRPIGGCTIPAVLADAMRERGVSLAA